MVLYRLAMPHMASARRKVVPRPKSHPPTQSQLHVWGNQLLRNLGLQWWSKRHPQSHSGLCVPPRSKICTHWPFITPAQKSSHRLCNLVSRACLLVANSTPLGVTPGPSWQCGPSGTHKFHATRTNVLEFSTQAYDYLTPLRSPSPYATRYLTLLLSMPKSQTNSSFHPSTSPPSICRCFYLVLF